MATNNNINVVAEIKNAIEKTLKISADKLDFTDDFESIGMESIIAMEFITYLSKQVGIQLSPVIFTNIATPEELATHIEKELGQDERAAASAAAPEPVNTTRLAATQQPEAVPQQGPQSGKIAAIINYVQSKYSIDLSCYRFDSVEDIANTLVANYGEQFAQYHDALLGNLADLGALSRASEPTVNLKGKEGVSIVGMACRFADADNHGQFWDNLLAKKSSIEAITPLTNFADMASAEPVNAPPQRWGAKLKDVAQFDSEFFALVERDCHLLDPQERILFEEIYNACLDAGTSLKDLRASNTGVFVGYEYSEYEQALRNYRPVVEQLPPFTSSNTAFYLANRVSHALGLSGPSEAFNVNCVSSAMAINRAYLSLQSGECDVAIVCGVSLNLFDDDYDALTKRGLLSASGRCGVFDEDADGYTRGEGVAALVLTRKSQAVAEKKRVYANLKGVCQRNRGASQNIAEVKHEAISELIASSCQRANARVEDLRYIEVNGYATKWGDSFEFEGIRNLFDGDKNHSKRCALGSLKGNIGHLEPANGIASVIKVALSLYHKKFPATISVTQESSFIDTKSARHPLYIAKSDIEFSDIREGNTPVLAGVNSFSDSGVNVHLLLEEATEAVPNKSNAHVSSKELFLLSAKSEASLLAYVDRYIALLDSGAVSEDDLADMLFTLQCGRDHYPYRLAIRVSSVAELHAKLTTVQQAGSLQGALLVAQSIFAGDASNNASVQSLITKDMVEFQVRRATQSQAWGEVLALWVNGIDVEWGNFWQSGHVNTLSLPAYPYNRKTFWADQYFATDDVEEQGRVAISDAEKTDTKQSAVNPQGSLLSKIMARLTALLSGRDGQAVSAEKDFMSLGIPSLTIAKAVHTLNTDAGIKLSPVVVYNNSSIAELAKYLLDNHSKEMQTLFAHNDASEDGLGEVIEDNRVDPLLADSTDNIEFEETIL
ncbi:hypothetical protein A7985_22805 [Pseudoalteromonas luteoviolacea]|uniref:Carrier domain-containing protein n=1 Tax=Pseudoalteromonas luteoviolacea TaxID=43657 RepID=A0A1C0TJV0_9GAMM|nr:beta-ketoacyl synthase N-terminal-like domain-containing protein [Pseudoalteromonas luteoviolacea]OCQ18848.1 hypothetical protein A7985_22805 [Pseudoalteromonas luteoviolacea]